MKIVNALSELCKQRPYEKIGVSDIVAYAKISRSGFYHHFEDKNSVVQWLSLQCYNRGIDEIGRTLTWFEGHMVTTKGMNNYAELFAAAKDCKDFGAGQPFFIRHRIETLKETIIKYQHKEVTPLLKFQIEALPHVELYASEKYFEKGFEYSLKEFCDNIITLVPNALYKALEHPAQHRETKGLLFME